MGKMVVWTRDFFLKKVHILGALIFLISFSKTNAMDDANLLQLWLNNTLNWELLDFGIPPQEIKQVQISLESVDSSHKRPSKKKKTESRPRGWENKCRKKDDGTKIPVNGQEFKEMVCALSKQCLICKRNELNKLLGRCPDCAAKYEGQSEKTNNYRLFTHWVEAHDSTGPTIYKYAAAMGTQCNIDTCTRKLHDYRGLSFHIVTKHVCKWVADIYEQHNHSKQVF